MLECDGSAPATAHAGLLGRSRRGRAWVVTIGGDLGPATLPPVREALEEILVGGAEAIVVDAKAVTSADTGVLELLLQLRPQAALCLAAPSPPVQRLLEIAGPDSGVPAVPSLGEALDAVGM
jgi:anti-anti-sigma factor